MQYSDPFIALVNDIGHENVSPLTFLAHERWLLELNIDPEDAVLEIRRSLGDRHGTCLRCNTCRLLRCLVPSRSDRWWAAPKTAAIP